jgi:transposase-like protein
LEEEGLDFVRASLTWVVQQLMEAEVSELVGAARGERAPEERLTHRNAYPPRVWGDAGGRDRAGDPEDPPRQLRPEFSRASPPQRASVGGGSAGGLRRWRLDAEDRPVGRVAGAADLQERVSRICAGLDGQVEAFRGRPLEGRYPYLWLDTKIEKARDSARVVRKALVLAYAVHQSGYREVIGLDVGESETEAFWRCFLRGLVKRGLAGVQLVVSDAHEGLKNAIAQVLGCPWQRCTVHFILVALGHARKEQQPMLAALLRPIFSATRATRAASCSARSLERLDGPLPKIAELLSAAEDDLLACYAFPADHRTKLRSTNPLGRFNREIGRRTDVVGIFPNDRSLIRLAASVVIEQNDEWLVGRRYLSNHSLEAILTDFNKDNSKQEARKLTDA